MRVASQLPRCSRVVEILRSIEGRIGGLGLGGWLLLNGLPLPLGGVLVMGGVGMRRRRCRRIFYRCSSPGCQRSWRSRHPVLNFPDPAKGLLLGSSEARGHHLRPCLRTEEIIWQGPARAEVVEPEVGEVPIAQVVHLLYFLHGLDRGEWVLARGRRRDGSGGGNSRG